MPKIVAGFPFKLDGKHVNIGDELSVDDETAGRKVADGHARIVDDSDKKAEESKAPDVADTGGVVQGVSTGDVVENVTSTSTNEHVASTDAAASGPVGKSQKTSKAS
jgi:hypothetical protein